MNLAPRGLPDRVHPIPKKRFHMFMEVDRGCGETRPDVLFAALDRRRVFEAPVNAFGAARKHRAVVARVIETVTT